MSWASRRCTTRVEDKAYSLLGLFDISMPLIYREGYATFTRLLEEIIRQHSDQTFLASQSQYVEFLPQSPDDFRNSGHVVGARSRALAQYYRLDHEPYPFYMANRGLQMTMPIVTTIGCGFVFGGLACWDL